MKKLILASAALLAFAVPAAARSTGSRTAAMFDHADANGDGMITRAEFAAARAARFAKMDRNKDGAISSADLPRMKRAANKLKPLIEMLVAQSDANRDGKVSRAEMANGPMPIFDRADANSDGAIDKAELAVVRERLAAIRD